LIIDEKRFPKLSEIAFEIDSFESIGKECAIHTLPARRQVE